MYFTIEAGETEQCTPFETVFVKYVGFVFPEQSWNHDYISQLEQWNMTSQIVFRFQCRTCTPLPH